MDELRGNCCLTDEQLADSDWQLESLRAGAAGIEIEHAIFRLLLGNVGVAVDDGVDSRGFRLQIESFKNVQNVDGDPLKFEELSFWNISRPRLSIYVASDRGDWGDFAQSIENNRIADVPGVDDVV